METYHDMGTTYVPTWRSVGGANVSTDTVGELCLATGPGGATLLAYYDGTGGTARQLAGNTWSVIGGTFSSSALFTPSAVYDSGGAPYVLFEDLGFSNAATVMQFDGTNWVLAGPRGFSAGTATYTSLAIDSSDQLYAAYSDGGTSPPGEATVQKFNGVSWAPLGSPGFSGIVSGVSYTCIAIDSADTPYVAYADGNNGMRATVMRYNGSSWVLVGTVAGFTSGSVAYVSLAIDPSDQPWVAFSDTSVGGRATVMEFQSGSWVIVGNQGFSTGTASYVSLKFDHAGRADVAFSDAGVSGKAVAYMLNGSSWKRLGGILSNGIANFISLAIDSANAPLCAFQDPVSLYATVKKFH